MVLPDAVGLHPRYEGGWARARSRQPVGQCQTAARGGVAADLHIGSAGIAQHDGRTGAYLLLASAIVPALQQEDLRRRVGDIAGPGDLAGRILLVSFALLLNFVERRA